MRTYELVLVLRPSLKDAERKKLLDTVKSWLKDVKFAKEDEWGQKPLSFTVKKENSGFYLKYLLESDAFPLDFEKKVTAQDDILRHLLLRKN